MIKPSGRIWLFAASSLTLLLMAGVFSGPSASVAQEPDSFAELVSENGSIRVPEDYREHYVYLGTFSVAGGDPAGGAAEMHQVYVDPASVEYYRENGAFPDGAVIVKELQNVASLDLTTGHASFWDGNKGWFVMIKDTEGRYPESGLWGDGWGWAFYEAGNAEVPVTKDYISECTGCHMPVRATDWIHVWAYPLLDAKDKRATLEQ